MCTLLLRRWRVVRIYQQQQGDEMMDRTCLENKYYQDLRIKVIVMVNALGQCWLKLNHLDHHENTFKNHHHPHYRHAYTHSKKGNQLLAHCGIKQARQTMGLSSSATTAITTSNSAGFFLVKWIYKWYTHHQITWPKKRTFTDNNRQQGMKRQSRKDLPFFHPNKTRFTERSSCTVFSCMFLILMCFFFLIPCCLLITWAIPPCLLLKDDEFYDSAQ